MDINYYVPINDRPTGLNCHLSIRNSTMSSSEGFIFAYEQTHLGTNQNQQWQRKS